MQMHNPSHPGRLLAYYLQGRSVTEVARHLGVTRPALSRVFNGKAGVSADMALRISEAFKTDPEFWLRLQAQRDLWVASRRGAQKLNHSLEAQPRSFRGEKHGASSYNVSGGLIRENARRRLSHSSELKKRGPTSMSRGIMLKTATRDQGRPSRWRNPFSFRSLTMAE